MTTAQVPSPNMNEANVKPIPKIIHYCWFGNKPIPEQLQAYINSWRIHCPSWEIRLWSEANFDVSSHPFVESAYDQKKYAYVSDYVRALALYEYGGVYFDTDVEVKRPIDTFCQHQAFSGFEKIGLPFSSAIWGSIPKHSLSKKILSYYQDKTVYDATTEQPNTVWIAKILEDHFHIDCAKDQLQIGDDGKNSIHIYPSTHFCLDLPEHYTTHHFSGSWLEETNSTYKSYVHTQYFLRKILTDSTSDLSSKDNLKFIAASMSIAKILKLLRYRIKLLIQQRRKSS
ncbi:MAG: glycosyltransferase [Moraxellaceae bacterium]